MEIEELYQVFKDHPYACTDTRKIKEGCIFFALKGENFNGNKFSETALNNGAAYAIIDEKEYLTSDYHILVDDVLNTLQQLAAYHRKQLDIPIIGITGTNGKTTTKELMYSILSQQYFCYATKGNLNNHIGVPLSVLEINKTHQMAIIEMGANHTEEIEALCKISQPNFGLITNVGKAHLEGFGSFEGVKKAKSELYDYLREHDRPVFINGDNKILTELAEGCFQITYGVGEQNHIIGKIESDEETLVVSWKKLNYFGYTQPIKTNLTGAYNLENILAAICVGNYFELSERQIEIGLISYTPSNNRSQLMEKGSNQLILDAYNANPVSMMAALENLKTIKTQKQKVAILGDMKELGKYSSEEHQKIVDFLISNNIDSYLVGSEFLSISNDKIPSFSKTEELIEYLIENPIKNALILLKGSRSIGLEKLIDRI